MINIQFDLVVPIEHPEIPKIRLACVPRVGETVDIPGVSQANTVVRTVVWYPFEDPDPIVYVVLGPPRPN